MQMGLSITRIDSPFSPHDLEHLEFCRDFLARAIPSMRWSGLGGTNLDPEDMKYIKVVRLGPGDGQLLSKHLYDDPGDQFFLLFILVQAKKEIDAIIYPVPVKITVTCGRMQLPQDIMHAFEFDGGIHVGITVAPREPEFWKKFLRVLLQNAERLGGQIAANRLDHAAVKALLDDDLDTWHASILGGGDTTNIIFRIDQQRGMKLRLVVKFYPRVAFNMTGLLTHLLESSGFSDISHLQMVFTYTPDFLQTLLHEMHGKSPFNEIQEMIMPTGLSVPEMFPFIHVFEFVPSSGDGGAPFWESASRMRPGVPGQDTPSPLVLNLARILGKATARFHSSLDRGDLRHGMGSSGLYRSLKVQIETKVNVVSKILNALCSTNALPPPFLALVKIIDEMLGEAGKITSFMPPPPGFESLHLQLVHQDLHMGQLLVDPGQSRFIFLDLEGDPQLPWAERLETYPVEKDVASLLRSLSYIKVSALKATARDVILEKIEPFLPLCFLLDEKMVASNKIGDALLPVSTQEKILPLKVSLDAWERSVQDAIVEGYKTTRGLDSQALRVFLLDRVLNECIYEARYRPINVLTPVIGLHDILRSRA